MSKSLTLNHNQVTVDFSQFFQQSQPRPTAQGPPLNVTVSIQPDGTWTVSSQHLAILQPFLDSLRARDTPLLLPKDVHTFVHKANHGRRITTVAYILDHESSEVVYNCSVFHKEHRKCKPNGKPFLPYHSESHIWTAVVRLYRRPQKLKVTEEQADTEELLHQAILDDIPRSIRQPKGSQRVKEITKPNTKKTKEPEEKSAPGLDDFDSAALQIARDAIEKLLSAGNLRFDVFNADEMIQKMRNVAESLDFKEIKDVTERIVEEAIRNAAGKDVLQWDGKIRTVPGQSAC